MKEICIYNKIKAFVEIEVLSKLSTIIPMRMQTSSYTSFSFGHFKLQCRINSLFISNELYKKSFLNKIYFHIKFFKPEQQFNIYNAIYSLRINPVTHKML